MGITRVPRLLFLDIDGVMNNDLGRLNKTCGVGARAQLYQVYNEEQVGFDPHAVQLLKEACEELDLKIVVASAWNVIVSSSMRDPPEENPYRDHPDHIDPASMDYDPLEAMKKIFGVYGLQDRIIGMAPNRRDIRGERLDQWFQMTQDLIQVDQYAVLDDMDDFGKHQERLVHVDGRVGLQSSDIDALRRLYI